MIQGALEQYVTFLGLGISALPNPRFQTDGRIIVSQASSFSQAWCDLARTDVRVYNALRKICQGGAWGGVIIATAGIVVPIAANHELVPAFAGALFSAALESDSDVTETVEKETANTA
jgi:hypothetical protein